MSFSTANGFPAAGRSTGKVVAIGHITGLGQPIGQGIETTVGPAITMGKDDGRMLPGRQRDEGLAIDFVAATHTARLFHAVGRV